MVCADVFVYAVAHVMLHPLEEPTQLGLESDSGINLVGLRIGLVLRLRLRISIGVGLENDSGINLMRLGLGLGPGIGLRTRLVF